MTDSPNVCEFEIRDLPITKVVVLKDRAEVKRLVKTPVKKGINEIKLKSCTQSMLRDSLRVEGRGKATIIDVTEKNTPALREESESPKVVELRKALKEHEQAKQHFEDQKNIIQKRIESLDRIISEAGSGVVNPPKEQRSSFLLDNTTLEGLQNLFDFYDKNAEKLKIKIVNLRAKEQEIEIANDIVNKARNEFNHAINAFYQNPHARHVYITLEAEEDGEVELDVTYQVSNVSWTPSYDIRVDTSIPSMTITYYGKIDQHTGEDWNNFHAVLSTAQPSLNGIIPELGTLDAVFYRSPPSPVVFEMKKKSSRRVVGNMRMRASVLDCDSTEESHSHDYGMDAMQMAVTSEVVRNALSTEFKIVRETTIPTGTDDHKVTIGVVKLVPSLVHESVPSKNASAFLTASAINSSQFVFLPGNSSIYLNNAFVAQTFLKDVSPGEGFSCSLGVDTAIRVEYKPAKKNQGIGGYINKHIASTTEQMISIKNTRTEQPILITVKHHIPRSTDDKIKIKLLNPVAIPYDANADHLMNVTEPNEGAKFNSHHNLEWTVKIEPGTTKHLALKWSLEHPKEEKVEFQEVFGQ